MILRRVLSFALVASTLAPSLVSADVRMVLSNGRVSIAAEDATVADILWEWARVGHTHFVNLDRISGRVMTLVLDVPEEEALELLLGPAAAGYVAAPRATRQSHLSRFDRVVIMAASRTAREEDATPEGIPPQGPVVENDGHQTPLPEAATIGDEADGTRVFGAVPRRAAGRIAAPPSDEARQEQPAFVPPPAQTVLSAPPGSASPVPGVIVQPPSPVNPRNRPPGQ